MYLNNIFDVAEYVYAIDVAERCGLEIHKNKAICPFHEDNHPSLSFKNGRFYCFVCNTGGNCIDFISHFYKLSLVDSAKMICDMYGFDYYGKNGVVNDGQKYYIPVKPKKSVIRVLRDYLSLMYRWSGRFVPIDNTDDSIDTVDDRFVYALNEIPYVECLIDFYYEYPSERDSIDVEKYRKFLEMNND